MREAIHDSRTRRRWSAVAAGLGLGSVLLACSSSSSDTTGDGGSLSDGPGTDGATAGPFVDGATDSGADATLDAASDGGTTGADAGPDGMAEAGVDGGVDSGFLCSPDAAIAIAGDYLAPDGSERWLRKTATAATFTIVPGGAPDAGNLPALYRVASVCTGAANAGALALAGLDGTFARLDWRGAAGATAVKICLRTAADTAAALALPAADATSTATGCAGAAWLALTQETP